MTNKSQMPWLQGDFSGLFFFGLLWEDSWLAWKLTDVRDAAKNEYAIYIVEAPDRSPKCVAATFGESVEKKWKDARADSNWDDEESGPRMGFCPAAY